MKKMLFTLMAMMTIVVNANAMTYEQARNEALFLTDKMAYELNLSDAQYEAAYEINLDYLMGVTSQYDVFGPYWERRNLDLSYILFSWQWDAFRAATYFYRPLFWEAGYWHFGIYARYPHRDYFYFGRPHFYTTYRGGHSWRMNGGHSYYEGRHDFYRPSGHNRDNHFGMRNGWDRGDYRNGRGGHTSSTHITGDNPNNGRGGHGSLGNNGGSFGNNQGNRSGFGSGRNGGNWRNGDGNQNNNGGGNLNNGGGNLNNGGGNLNNGGGNLNNGGGNLNNGGGNLNNRGNLNTNGGGSFGGSRNGGGSFGSTRGGGTFNNGGGTTRSGGSFGGGTTRSGGNFGGGATRSGGSFGGGATRSGGSFGGGSRSNSHGNFGGGRR